MNDPSTAADKPWPSVSFLSPVLNGGNLLTKLFRSIREQDYPGKIEIIMVDGGSTDDSVRIAKEFGAIVVPNPFVLGDPGAVVARSHATGEILVYAAADNGLPRRDWLRLIVQPFLDRPSIMGVYTQIVPAPGDNSFTEYYCRLHVEPFTWFVYGNAANPRNFHSEYRIKHQTDAYVIYDFTPMTHPVVALAQGFAVRRSFERRPGYDNDDILPVIQMMEEGSEIAYVPEAGVFHHHLSSFRHYVAKYRWRINNSLYTNNAGFDNRRRFLTRRRRIRKYLFAAYGATLILPLLDGIWLALRERRWCMLWHAPASTALSWIAVTAYARKLLSWRRTQRV